MPSIFGPEKGNASKADPEISENFQMEKIGQDENSIIGHALETMDGESDLEHRQMIQEKSDTSRFLKMTLRYCRFFSRVLASAVAVVFAIYLIYLTTYEPDSAGAAGMRVTLSFRQCWLNGSKLKERCDWQIARSFQGIDRQHSIKKQHIWSDSLTRNFSAAPASGTWEGEFLVGFSLASIGEAVVLDESLRRMSERDLLDIALLNALPDRPFLSRIHIIKVCSSSKLREGRLRFVQSVANQVHQEKLRELVTPIPDCIFTL